MERMGAGGPTHVGPFETVGVLGQGGMGRVLLCAGPDGRLVAVKQVLAHFADDEAFRARFRREVTASRKVSGAYTAAVIDADPDAPTPWLASVFVAGPSLGAVVKAVGVLPEEVVRRLAAGLTSALAEIHRAGLVHRDLKPDNVLLAEDGVRVIDLGIAREADGGAEGDTGLTRTGWVVGSPAYMSPEQAEGKPLTPASDVFSLGSVLAMAATGRSPFLGPSTLRTLYDVVHTEPDLSGVPEGLRGLVARCLAKDPQDRPSPAELRELIGPVTPAGRQWPSAVYGMAADQRAGIEGLLRGRETDGPAPQSPPDSAPESVPGPASETLPLPGSAAAEPLPQDPPQRPTGTFPPPQDQDQDRDRPRWGGRRRVAALAAAGVLLVAGTGVVAYVRDRANDPVAYTRTPTCPEVRGRMPLKNPAPSLDTRSQEGWGVRTGCTWNGNASTGAPRALVRWELSLGGDATADAGAQRGRFRVEAAERTAADVGFGTEAYWVDRGADWACGLAVREGNLSVWVGLHKASYETPACQEKAKEVARAALKAASRSR
ncbi:protein kinase [Streptomyces sp. NPDC008265]|uniref:serine/threonine-protein kinase n=1 Tax=Streptomyces sp. NPDC008265 TaxID=3364824 RepID=UPI0036EF2F4F